MIAEHDTQAPKLHPQTDYVLDLLVAAGHITREKAFHARDIAVEFAPRLQEQEGQPALSALLERAAWICECYAEFIRSDVMAADIERHPYLPEIEGTAEDLRATLAAGSQAVQVPEATQDELIDFAEALERRRCITIAQTVMAEMAGFTNPPFTAGFNQACEEIAHRIEHEEWVFQDPAAPQQPLAGGEGHD